MWSAAAIGCIWRSSDARIAAAVSEALVERSGRYSADERVIGYL